MNVNQATLVNNYTRFVQTTQQQHSDIVTMNNSFQRLYRQLIDLNYTDNEIFLQQRLNELRQQRQQQHLNRIQTIATENRDIISQFADLRPVEIYPSPEQINNSTRIVHFSDISSPPNSACPIRSETFNNDDIVMQINHCNHVFYPSELYNWFRSHVRCPLCRFDIRDDISNSDTTNNSTTNNSTTNNSTTNNSTTHRLIPGYSDLSNSSSINLSDNIELNNLSSNITRQIMNEIRTAHNNISDNQSDASVSWSIIPSTEYRTIHRPPYLNHDDNDSDRTMI